MGTVYSAGGGWGNVAGRGGRGVGSPKNLLVSAKTALCYTGENSRGTRRKRGYLPQLNFLKLRVWLLRGFV